MLSVRRRRDSRTITSCRAPGKEKEPKFPILHLLHLFPSCPEASGAVKPSLRFEDVHSSQGSGALLGSVRSCSCGLDVPRQPGPRSSCSPAAELNQACKTSSHAALPFQLPSRAGWRRDPEHSPCCVSPGGSPTLSSLCWLVVWAGKPSLHVTRAAAC